MSIPLKRIAAVVSLVLSGNLLVGCATPQLDARISELKAQLDSERTNVAPLADPYRGATGKDIQLDLSGKPLLDTIEKYNELSDSDHWFTMSSYSYQGHIAYSWTDCPWPFPGRIGFKIVPAFDDALQVAIHLERIDATWNASDGMAFRLKRTLGAGAFLVGGEVEICKLRGTLPIGGALLLAGAESAAGRTTLTPIPNEGLEYRLKLTQPIYMLAIVVTPVWEGAVPLWSKFELSKGKIPNIMGKEGEIQISETGQARRYKLNILLDSAGFLDQGLTASGPVEIIWLTPSSPN